MDTSPKKIAILFDLAGTLYDSERGELYLGVRETLAELSKIADLYLVTRREGRREDLIKELDIESFFTDIAFVDRKTKKHFEEFVARKRRKYEEVFCVGDVIWEEIAIGNKLGWKTVRMKQGKFEDSVPKSEEEIPWKTISNIGEARAIFKK